MTREERLAELEAEHDRLLRERDATQAALSKDRTAYAAFLEQQRDEAIEARKALELRLDERRAAARKAARRNVFAAIREVDPSGTIVTRALTAGVLVGVLGAVISVACR